MEQVAVLALITISGVAVLAYILYKLWTGKKIKNISDNLGVSETVQIEEYKDVIVHRNVSWFNYGGATIPLYLYEIPMWNYLPTEAKVAYVKKLKEEVKSGKRIVGKDDDGKINAYKVTDKKLIQIEIARAEINKKVVSL